MRAVTAGILAGGLLWSLGAAAGGYGYPGPPSGRDVIWPPPGGVDRSRPPLWQPPPQPAGPGYREPPPGRYLPSYRYRGGFVPPPGPDWPGVEPPPRREPPPPLEPGRPVEVVPPPGIPVEEMEQQLSRQPQRGWRPVPRGASLPVAPGQPQKERTAAPAAKGSSPGGGKKEGDARGPASKPPSDS